MVGVDVGGTKLLAVRLDPDGTVVPDIAIAVPQRGPAVVEEVAAAAHRLAGPGGPGAIGVGVPGLVDGTGTVRFAPNLQGLVGTPVTEALGDALPGWRVWVGNDATAAGWGEHARGRGPPRRRRPRWSPSAPASAAPSSRAGGWSKAATGMRASSATWWSTRTARGARAASRGAGSASRRGAAWGRWAGRPPSPGRPPAWSHWPAATPRRCAASTSRRRPPRGTGRRFEIMDRFGWWVALGLANLANALDPGLIVVGGGLISAGDVLIEPTRRAFAALVEAPFARAAVQIEPAMLGSRSGRHRGRAPRRRRRRRPLASRNANGRANGVH